MSRAGNMVFGQRNTGNSMNDSLLGPSYAMSLLRTNNHSGQREGDGPQP